MIKIKNMRVYISAFNVTLQSYDSFDHNIKMKKEHTLSEEELLNEQAESFLRVQEVKDNCVYELISIETKKI